MSKLISRLGRKAKQTQRALAREFKVYNRAEVSRSAVLHNYQIIKQASGGLEVMPVLKADAYGHDIEIYAEIYKQVKPRYIVVDGYFEAERIWRVSGQPVLIMGAIAPENFTNLPHKNAAYFVQDEETVEAIGKTGRPFVVHLECDTGMSRYGVSKEELPKVLQVLKKYPHIQLEGVATHFAEADNPKSNFLDKQLERFEDFLSEIIDFGYNPSVIHSSNTAGAARVRKDYLTAVRTGIASHGVSTLNEGSDSGLYTDLKPTMRIISTITKIRHLNKGDSVSYGRTFTAKKDMTIGVLPLGYFEAIPRDLSNKGVVTLGEQELPIVGRVCMNHTIVDISGKDAAVGDEVVVIDNDSSKKNSFNGWREHYKLHPHMTMTGISRDLRKVVVD